jgi:hypothetical protein
MTAAVENESGLSNASIAICALTWSCSLVGSGVPHLRADTTASREKTTENPNFILEYYRQIEWQRLDEMLELWMRYIELEELQYLYGFVSEVW